MTRFLIALTVLLGSASSFANTWITASNGQTGPRPVYVGREGSKDVYVCRVGENGIVGKLVKADGKCYIGYYGKEYAYTTYQVLQDRLGRSYRFFYVTSLTDPYLVHGGMEGGQELHICRVRRAEGFVGGKMVGTTQNGKCYYGWYGKELVSTLFEALSDA